MSAHGKMGNFDSARESWTSYAERLDFYFVANGITEDETKKAIFITVVGTHTYSLLKSLLQPQTPRTASLDDMKAALEAHFSPKPSSIVQRYKFHTRIRKPTETVATYVAELRAIEEHCDFGDSLEAMIRDRLVCGINNARIQRRLLQEPDLTYKSAFEKAQAMDAANITESKPAPVHHIRNKQASITLVLLHNTRVMLLTLLRWNVTDAEGTIMLQNVVSVKQNVEHVARKVTLLVFAVAQLKDCPRLQSNLSRESQALQGQVITTQTHSSIPIVYTKNHSCHHPLLLRQTTHCLHFMLTPSPLLLQSK